MRIFLKGQLFKDLKHAHALISKAFSSGWSGRFYILLMVLSFLRRG